MDRGGMRAGLWPAATAVLLASAAEAAETVAYTYDALGRLTATSITGSVNNGVSTGIGYDPAGNRLSYSVDGGSGPPAPTSFAVGDAAAAEGGTLVFTVSKTGGAAASVAYSTADGSAAAGSDYQETSGALDFAAGESSRTVIVATDEDGLDESDETLSLNLSGASAGSSIADAQGTGTIADNDGAPPPPPAGNNPPTLTNKSGSQAKCTTKIHTVVTRADTDVDGDYPLTLVSVEGWGFTLVSSTEVQFTSDAAAGTRNGKFTVQDSRGARSTASINVTVSGGFCQNEAPPPGPLEPLAGGGGGS